MSICSSGSGSEQNKKLRKTSAGAPHVRWSVTAVALATVLSVSGVIAVTPLKAVASENSASSTDQKIAEQKEACLGAIDLLRSYGLTPDVILDRVIGLAEKNSEKSSSAESSATDGNSAESSTSSETDTADSSSSDCSSTDGGIDDKLKSAANDAKEKADEGISNATENIKESARESAENIIQKIGNSVSEFLSGMLNNILEKF